MGIRSFKDSSSDVFNRAQSTGALYQPGFAFEDRQYQLFIKHIAVFQQHNNYVDATEKTSTSTLTPIIDPLNLRACLGLPIMFEQQLIIGYLLEASLSTPDVCVYLGTSQL